jgi:hypothetical protein
MSKILETHCKGMTMEEFLDLETVTHEEKKRVFFRSIPKKELRLLAIEFLDRGLNLYESKYPNDDRPRKAIESARNDDSDININMEKYILRASAAAYAAAAYSAVYNAADAYVAAAVYAANFDVPGAVYDYAAQAIDVSRSKEEKAQIEIMKRYAREASKEIREKAVSSEVKGD